ncbi:hypothetical protein BH24ACT22_BH24ACT22_09160 [soil metagenome]
MKKDWQTFKKGDSGSRFMDRYDRRQEGERGWKDPSRLFNVIVGTVLVVGSAFFGWAPGPGMLTFVIGLAMIAGEFRFAARFLDWGEVRANGFWRFVKNVWQSSIAGKILVLLVLVALISAVAYVTYYFFFRG